MKLHIEHETIFTYAQPVREAIGEAKLRPSEEAGQRLLSFRLALDPHTPLDIVTDRFDNTIHGTVNLTTPGTCGIIGGMTRQQLPIRPPTRATAFLPKLSATPSGSIFASRSAIVMSNN